jgi:hypothetical protein
MLGYLNGISFLGYDPNSQKISLNILRYPFISYHIPTYPKISSGANSQMGPAPPLPIPPQSSAQPTPQLPPAAPPQPQPPSKVRKRPHYMCSNDLLNALPAEVYTTLDASSHLEITVRAKLHKSIESSGLANQLDLAVAAPFGYQTSLQHSRGAPWNPLARGLALALTGRYVHVDATGSVDSDDQDEVEAHRHPVIERLRSQWQAMLPTWSSDHKTSLTDVGHLWHGVTWVWRERARNTTRWMCPEVLAGCVRQVRNSDRTPLPSRTPSRSPPRHSPPSLTNVAPATRRP